MRPPSKLRFTTLARNTAGAFALFATINGCGAAVPIFAPSPPGPPNVQSEGWLGPVATNCVGTLRNTGEVATDIRVEVAYADAVSESVRVVVPTHTTLGTYHAAHFTVPAQVTNGELRFPRLVRISWNGGSNLGTPRKPLMQFGYVCRVRADTLIAWFGNIGGWAYHLRAIYEDRDGMHDVAIDPAAIPPGGWNIYSLPRDSAGVQLPPLIRMIRWEDYGGALDSLVDVPTDTIHASC